MAPSLRWLYSPAPAPSDAIRRRSPETTSQTLLGIAICLFVINIVFLFSACIVFIRVGAHRKTQRPKPRRTYPAKPGRTLPGPGGPPGLPSHYVAMSDIIGPSTQQERDALRSNDKPTASLNDRSAGDGRVSQAAHGKAHFRLPSVHSAHQLSPPLNTAEVPSYPYPAIQPRPSNNSE